MKWRMMLLGWGLFAVGHVIRGIGSSIDPATLGWGHVSTVAFLTGIPALLGWMAGREGK